jgi:hypothetical protein
MRGLRGRGGSSRPISSKAEAGEAKQHHGPGRRLWPHTDTPPRPRVRDKSGTGWGLVGLLAAATSAGRQGEGPLTKDA